MLDQIKGVHIETTNMCTLKCPKCARTEFLNNYPKAWKNTSLDLSVLKDFLDINLKGQRIYLCGNYGDAIYYDGLFELIEYVKQKGAWVDLATNGSYKSLEWWQELANLLDDQDCITFGVDGTPDNFTNYRINADWPSILVGIKTMVQSKAKVIWQYIPFQFNEGSIDSAKQISVELGVDEFKLFPSYRWADSDSLPVQVDPKTETRLHWQGSNMVDAECKRTNREHYISAEGYYMPCCYVGDHRFYYKSEFYKNKDLYDISKNTLSQILTRDQSINFYNSIEDAKLNYCTFNCPKI